MTSRSGERWTAGGAVVAGLAVLAGAFGAHLLGTRISEVGLGIWETAARYQMYHGLALLVVGLLAQVRPSKSLTFAGFCFVAGVAGFSGGLYAYTLSGQKWIGQFIVPTGGLLFLVGWTSLALAVCSCRK